MKANSFNVRIKSNNERRIDPKIIETYFKINFLIDDTLKKNQKIEIKTTLEEFNFKEVTYYNIRNFFKNNGVLVINDSDYDLIKNNKDEFKYLNKVLEEKNM